MDPLVEVVEEVGMITNDAQKDDEMGSADVEL